MRRFQSNRLRLAIICAVVAMGIVFVFDLLQLSPVMADVVERHGVVNNTAEEVTVSWVDGNGVTQVADVFLPGEYADESQIPIIPHRTSPYVDDGWLSLNWYFFAGLGGLIFGGVVATGLRDKNYTEAPIRQIVPGAGV